MKQTGEYTWWARLTTPALSPEELPSFHGILAELADWESRDQEVLDQFAPPDREPGVWVPLRYALSGFYRHRVHMALVRQRARVAHNGGAMAEAEAELHLASYLHELAHSPDPALAEAARQMLR